MNQKNMKIYLVKVKNIGAIVAGSFSIITLLFKLWAFQEYYLIFEKFLSFIEGDFVILFTIVITLFEFVSAIFLILRRKLVLFSIIQIVIYLFYIGIILTEKMTGRLLSSQFMRILDMPLELNAQIVFTLVLLNILFMVFFLEYVGKESKFNFIQVSISFMLIIYFQYSLLNIFYNNNSTKEDLSKELVSILYAKHLINYNHNYLLYVLSLNDFNCPLCYDDFILAVRFYDNKKDYKKIFAINSYGERDNNIEKRLSKWAKRNKLNGEIILLNDETDEIAEYIKSNLMIISKGGNINKIIEFPLEENTKNIMLNISN